MNIGIIDERLPNLTNLLSINFFVTTAKRFVFTAFKIAIFMCSEFIYVSLIHLTELSFDYKETKSSYNLSFIMCNQEQKIKTFLYKSPYNSCLIKAFC